MENLSPDLVRFIFDNASGLTLGFTGMVMMYRLCDKHLSKISERLETLSETIQSANISFKSQQLSTEKALFRIDEKINQYVQFH